MNLGVFLLLVERALLRSQVGDPTAREGAIDTRATTQVSDATDITLLLRHYLT